MKKRGFILLWAVVLVSCATLSCLSTRVLLNGEKSTVMRNGCEVKIEAGIVSWYRVDFKITAMDDNVKITDVDKWLRELSDANEVNFKPIHPKHSYRDMGLKENIVSLKNNESFVFFFHSRDFFQGRKTRFVFPKSEHVSCYGRPLFFEQVEYAIETDGRRVF